MDLTNKRVLVIGTSLGMTALTEKLGTPHVVLMQPEKITIMEIEQAMMNTDIDVVLIAGKEYATIQGIDLHASDIDPVPERGITIKEFEPHKREYVATYKYRPERGVIPNQYKTKHQRKRY